MAQSGTETALEFVLGSVSDRYRIEELFRAEPIHTVHHAAAYKHVRSTNVMGATKRLAELVIESLSARGFGTAFSMVRFVNVLASSGSVVPGLRPSKSSSRSC